MADTSDLSDLFDEYARARQLLAMHEEDLRSRLPKNKRQAQSIQESRSQSAAASRVEVASMRERLDASWTGDPTELDRRIAMIDFREEVLVNTLGDSHRADRSKALAENLHQCWLASGHDLSDFNAFLAEVDREAAAMIPK